MPGECRQLSDADLISALSAIDPVEVLTAQLLDPLPTDAGEVGPWRLELSAADESGAGLAVLTHGDDEGAVVLAAAELRACRCAALAVLAARTLVPSSVLTVTVLGSGTAARLVSAVLARHLPGMTQLALHSAHASAEPVVTPDLVDQLDRAGVDLCVESRVSDAVFGANLIVVLDELPASTGARPAIGSVVVNASCRPLPKDFLDGFAETYVDDLRPWAGTGRGGPVDAELRQVLAGEHPGRTRCDDILLVDLLGAGLLDARLALALYRATAVLDLGSPATGQLPTSY